MGLVGTVNNQTLGRAFVPCFRAHKNTRGREGMERAGGRRIEDHPEPFSGQTKSVAQPAQRHNLQFRHGAGGLPQNAVGIQSGGQEFG